MYYAPMFGTTNHDSEIIDQLKAMKITPSALNIVLQRRMNKLNELLDKRDLTGMTDAQIEESTSAIEAQFEIISGMAGISYRLETDILHEMLRLSSYTAAAVNKQHTNWRTVFHRLVEMNWIYCYASKGKHKLYTLTDEGKMQAGLRVASIR